MKMIKEMSQFYAKQCFVSLWLAAMGKISRVS